MNDLLHINEKDNLAVCLRPIKKGETVCMDGKSYVANMDIAAFHKIATQEIEKGDFCYKYGQVIGKATEDIHVGDHAHIHNIESTRGRGDKAVH